MTFEEWRNQHLTMDGYPQYTAEDAWNAALKFAESDKQEAVVDDLRMLVQRLVHALNKASPSNDLGAKALDYLMREGLGGSILRNAESDKQEAVAIVIFCELIDDYQIATINREEDEAAKARVTLMNAYRAALSAPLTHSAESDKQKEVDAKPVAQIVGDDKTRRLIWRCNAFDYDVGTELYALDKDSK